MADPPHYFVFALVGFDPSVLIAHFFLVDQ